VFSTQRERDDESDLVYSRARHYNPRTGRFVQKDPIGFSGGDLNVYSYATCNPLSFTDPTGEATWSGMIHASLTEAKRKEIENGLKTRFTATFLNSKLIMYDRIKNTFIMSPNSRAKDYSTALDNLSIIFVDELPRGAVGQAQGNGVIKVSWKEYDGMSKQDPAAADIELAATIAHEMAHNEQLLGREPLVNVSAIANPGGRKYSTRGDWGTTNRVTYFVGSGTSSPTETDVAQEPFAYFLEGKLFINDIVQRSKLKSFANAKNWSEVYSASYTDPDIYWEQAIWKTTDGKKAPPPANLLAGTKF
jgi:RHS repeat-associated protein